VEVPPGKDGLLQWTLCRTRAHTYFASNDTGTSVIPKIDLFEVQNPDRDAGEGHRLLRPLSMLLSGWRLGPEGLFCVPQGSHEQG
jgi:hypothetical protein